MSTKIFERRLAVSHFYSLKNYLENIMRYQFEILSRIFHRSDYLHSACTLRVDGECGSKKWKDDITLKFE